MKTLQNFGQGRRGEASKASKSKDEGNLEGFEGEDEASKGEGVLRSCLPLFLAFMDVCAAWLQLKTISSLLLPF